ncbi:MAG TPA: ATP-binding cassette domain-containing protein [Proteobacteria bacterium]|nr:ATP-binding cassette domain-containing protein [Pseudomonadota bacterium]
MPRLLVTGLSYAHLGPFDFYLAAGKTVFLTGPSGGGKSLLLRALADLDPWSGEILLDGRPCAGFTAPEWRRRVALLPAESQWWHDRVGEHFQVCPSADQLAALGFAAGVETWAVNRLSSGEKQRLAMLRLLRHRPAVLLLDEPSANLDRENRERLEKFIGDYQHRQGAAILWVTHDQEQPHRVVGRVYHLENGFLQEVQSA